MAVPVRSTCRVASAPWPSPDPPRPVTVWSSTSTHPFWIGGEVIGTTHDAWYRVMNDNADEPTGYS